MLELSLQERLKKSYEVSDKTRDEAISLLKEFGRCLIVRPTGFGKTYLLCKIAELFYNKEYKDKNIIYVYPNDIIVNEIMGNNEYEDIRDRLTFFSYQKLAQNFSENGMGSSKAEIIEVVKNACVILIDEVHRSAALGFTKFIDGISEEVEIGANGVHILGVTATIDRPEQSETDWIKQDLFRGIEVFDYSLGDALKDGILLSPYVSRPIFDFDKETETIKGELKSIHKGSSCYNEKDMNQRVDRMKLEWGNNGKTIYEAIEEVGYKLDSANPDDSYLKFIVFFKDTNHMLEEGESIENYFRLAITKCFEEATGRKSEMTLAVEYVISDTADKAHNNVIKELCDRKDYRTYRNKPAEVGTYLDNGVLKYIQPKPMHIDLVFNISTIVMGYHVPYTSGVMLLRNINTGIPFYQMIGRCFSMKSTRRPIIYDVVLNTTKDYTNNTTNKLVRGIIESNLSYNERNSDKKEEIISAVQTGIDTGATDDFLARLHALSEDSFTYVDRVKYLYCDRGMPVQFVASDTGLSCSRVIKLLLEQGVNVAEEKSHTKYLIERASGNQYYHGLLRTACSKKASETYKAGSQRKKSTLWDAFLKIMRRG